ncbi:YtzC family protein [Peribacillus alkalitolerans]|uniref:YtzC family protein n=1 Tax=Peribacillus alkalitolerans TaxID=1550385 RepID=UPI0013D89399|nr:YtzC family protein [Peribacillus alkalitolerans]
MATRESVENLVQNCEDVIRIAQEQYIEGSKQEHYNDEHFTQSQQLLESAIYEIQKMNDSCNGQQREQLARMKMQLMQLQSDMSHLKH